MTVLPQHIICKNKHAFKGVLTGDPYFSSRCNCQSLLQTCKFLHELLLTIAFSYNSLHITYKKLQVVRTWNMTSIWNRISYFSPSAFNVTDNLVCLYVVYNSWERIVSVYAHRIFQRRIPAPLLSFYPPCLPLIFKKMLLLSCSLLQVQYI